MNQQQQAIERVVDLLDPAKNVLYNTTAEAARALLEEGGADAIRRLDGHFALVATRGQHVLLARSIGRPLRYFIAKRAAGPSLIAADRIDVIHRYLQDEGLADQFHPSYTRIAPAHHVGSPCCLDARGISAASEAGHRAVQHYRPLRLREKQHASV